jgi:hypothetical protein
VECTWDVASCSGANSVVSLACICVRLVCQFVPDHAKTLRFVSLPGQVTCLLGYVISESAAFLLSSVNLGIHSLHYTLNNFFPFPATYRWNLNLQAASNSPS